MRKRISLCLLLIVVGCGDNRPSNFAPVLTQQEITITMAEDDTVTIDATAHDPEEETIRYTATAPSHGTLGGSGPTYTYTPAADYVGSDELTITIRDDDNALEVPVHITVVAVDDAPVADSQDVAVERNVTRSVVLTGRDVDNPSAELIYEVMTEPMHGELLGDPPNLEYVPDTGYFGTDSFTFRVSDALMISAAATVSLTVTAVPVCGDGLMEGSEQCDDGNLVNDDGCSTACATPTCGDGITQLDRGEACDDGNTAADDGCDAQCQVDAFAPVSPVLVSAALACRTSHPAKGNHVAVDVIGTLYAAFKCGTSAYVNVSRDRGLSFGAPLELTDGIAGLNAEVAIATGGVGLVYAGIVQDAGDVYVRISQDYGATWSQALRLGTTDLPIISLTAFNDHVYLAFHAGDGLDVYRSAMRGGAFELTHVVLEIAAFNMLYDPAASGVFVAGDQGTFRVRGSADGGATWGTEATPPGTQFNSAWAAGNGATFVAGTNLGALGNAGLLYRIPSATQATSTAIPGLPVVTGSDIRTVAADFLGGAYVVTGLDGGGAQLDRAEPGATSLETPIQISATGVDPGVAALPGAEGAAVVFTEPATSAVFVAVYPNLIP